MRSEAVAPSVKLRGRICGVVLRHRPVGKCFTGESRRQTDREKPRGRRPSLGTVIEGRYIPVHVLNQREALTPALRC